MTGEVRAALPFTLRRSRDEFTASTVTSTTETVHGLLRLDAERLVIQWRLARQTDRIGAASMKSEEEVEAVREVVVPLDAVAGARVRLRWWRLGFGPEIVLTAADLRAFESVTGEDGLRLGHPAELVLRIRRSDRLLAREFGAELALALAEGALPPATGRREIEGPDE